MDLRERPLEIRESLVYVTTNIMTISDGCSKAYIQHSIQEVHGREETILTSEEYNDRYDLTDSIDFGVWADTFSSCHSIPSYLLATYMYHEPFVI